MDTPVNRTSPNPSEDIFAEPPLAIIGRRIRNEDVKVKGHTKQPCSAGNTIPCRVFPLCTAPEGQT
jgi:hypothetical protein